MTIEEIKLHRLYAWDYFSLHASQRLKTFYFFIILSIGMLGMIWNLYNKLEYDMQCMILGAIQFYVTFIFWRLDTRNRDLVRHGEDALTAIEAQIVLPEGEGVNALNIMSSEKEATFNIMIEAKKKDVPYIKYLTYSSCFARIFLIFGIIAIALCGMSTIRLIDSL